MIQTAKYSLSGWLSSSFALLLLVSAAAIGQSADSGSHARLTSKYSRPMLEAHQANSLDKIGDFYHYLNLLSAAGDQALQNQIKENIYALFESKNTVIDDFSTDVEDQIPLSYFLDNIASRQMVFSIVNQSAGQEFYRDYWIDSYDLEVVVSGIKKTRRLRQTIYLKPENKAFGTRQKTVLAVSLGPIR